GTVRGVAVDESAGVADRQAAETIRSKREWEIIEASIHGRKTTVTFLEAAVDYIEAGGERRYLKPLIDYFGTIPLAKINQAAIDRAADILKPGSENSTRDRQIYTPMSAVLKRAAKRDLCEWRQIERPSLPKGRVRWVTPSEADRLIRACSPHLRPLVVFLFYTGARVSEATYLDWQQVDLERRQVQFLATKNGEARGVPLHPRVIQALEMLPHREGAVFRRSDGRPYQHKTDGGGQIKTGFRGACKRAGITNFHPHDCRHTWATWHYAANRDLVALMELGGWKSERMVLRYAHMNVAHHEQSVGALPWGKSGDPEKATG
ncbi:MAG TPA: site-specific integrase, partial [Candidatus Binataceae bacterium]|nr:site-specific integrase [Candidatus Binataceae bacterium]